MSLHRMVMDHWSAAGCPNCGYSIDIQLADIAFQVLRICPCCLAEVRFVEHDASVSTASRQIRQAEQRLRDALGDGR